LIENIDPTSKQSSTDLQKGLLSLLSNLNQSNAGKTNHRRERDISPLPQPPNRESELFIPLLPSQHIPSSRSSEYGTFVSKYVFSTIGIPPLTQRTKHGMVKITPKGNIELHLPSISRNTFSISSDSKRITATDGRGIVWKGDVDELPWRWTKVYRYASRFVGICRARIPQIGVEIDGVRGRIMLNGDFEASNTREGIVLRLNPELRALKVLSIDGDVENLRWQGDVNEIPPAWRDLLRSSTHLYQKCLAMDKGTSFNEEADNTAVCVPGIGWCAIHGKRVQFLFEDGSQMEMNMEDREIQFCDIKRRKERWRFDHDRLPIYIKDRLDRCTAFRDVG
jgi:hypothetical protein